MTTCDHPKGSCGQEIIWHQGKCYSPHFEAGHYSRINRGTGKPKAPKAPKPDGFAADVSDAEKASLEAALAAATENK